MAEILIRGMEMPESCEKCKLSHGYGTLSGFACGCLVTMQTRSKDCDIRPDWCPLIPVPDHGRLIDERWIKKAMITTLEAIKKNPKMDGQEMHLIAAFVTLRAMLDDAPTIIPASEVKDEKC